jgi:hypothetical protein
MYAFTQTALDLLTSAAVTTTLVHGGGEGTMVAAGTAGGDLQREVRFRSPFLMDYCS